MDRGVDPATTLRQQNRPFIRGDSVSVSITDELRLVHWEMFQQQRRKISILAKVEEILHVQRINPVLGVILNDLVGDEQRLMGVGCP